MSESELMSSYSTRGFIGWTPGGAASPWVKSLCPGTAEKSRLCLVDLCRLRLADAAEEEEEAVGCTLPSLPVMSAAWELCVGPGLCCRRAPPRLWPESGFLLVVPWCRSDPGMPHAGPLLRLGLCTSTKCIHGGQQRVAAPKLHENKRYKSRKTSVQKKIYTHTHTTK